MPAPHKPRTDAPHKNERNWKRDRMIVFDCCTIFLREIVPFLSTTSSYCVLAYHITLTLVPSQFLAT
jgi:hypothetical protein